jgi:hypothetical protein
MAVGAVLLAVMLRSSDVAEVDEDEPQPLAAWGAKEKRRGRDLNPRRTFQHVRDFQSRSLGHSDTSPCCEAEKEGFEPSMEAFTPITP